MKEVISYLKYRVKMRKLLFIGWIILFYAVYMHLDRSPQLNRVILFTIVGLGFSFGLRKKGFEESERVLPIKLGDKIIGEIIYFLLALIISSGLKMVFKFEVIKCLAIIWLAISIGLGIVEKYDLKKKLFRRMEK